MYMIIAGRVPAPENSDDYPEPAETLAGNVKDAAPRTTCSLKPATGDASLVLEELSWSSHTNAVLFLRHAGRSTFRNTKIARQLPHFRWKALLCRSLQYDGSGQVTVDKRKTMDVAEPLMWTLKWNLS